MTHTGKIVLGAAVAILVVLGLVFWYMTAHPVTSTGDMSETAGQAMVPAGTENTADTLPSGTNTSDSALTQDTATIDTQMKSIDADSASADAGISAQTKP